MSYPTSTDKNPDKNLAKGASGVAHENPAPGGAPEPGAALDFDDGTDMGHPRGHTQRTGGTWQAEGGDSAPLGPPAEVRSGTVAPDDADADTEDGDGAAP